MANVLDYKKEHKDLYSPKNQPSIINVPEIAFVAVEGRGDPNEENGEYKKAVELLYNIQYTIKMSKKGTSTPGGYFDYVVPPLEGLWWLADSKSDFRDKSKYQWISMIRLPEFADAKVFKWACDEASKKKKIDTGKAYFFKFSEGLCVQCMHIGPFDNEPETLAKMDKYISENNLIKDFSDKRRHHEIYLSDPGKVDPAKMKTVLRLPVREMRG